MASQALAGSPRARRPPAWSTAPGAATVESSLDRPPHPTRLCGARSRCLRGGRHRAARAPPTPRDVSRSRRRRMAEARRRATARRRSRPAPRACRCARSAAAAAGCGTPAWPDSWSCTPTGRISWMGVQLRAATVRLSLCRSTSAPTPRTTGAQTSLWAARTTDPESVAATSPCRRPAGSWEPTLSASLAPAATTPWRSTAGSADAALHASAGSGCACAPLTAPADGAFGHCRYPSPARRSAPRGVESLRSENYAGCSLGRDDLTRGLPSREGSNRRR